jgi:hypothetical protein
MTSPDASPERRRNPNSPKLRGWHFQLLVWSLLALWGTGATWLWLHHFRQVEGAFGPEPHPLEIWMLRLHGFFLIPALMMIGGVLVVHIGNAWRYRRKRGSGLTQAFLYLALILTGYGLYYAGDEVLREVASIAHWVIGLGAPVLFLWHWLVRGHKP